MNGCHTNNEGLTTFGKWAEINSTVKKEGIAILAIQESHLDQELITNLHEVYSKRLMIHNSEWEYAPRSSTGVAFTINRELINPSEIEITNLIAGRVIALKIKWKEMVTTLINIYTPNNKQENFAFWKDLQQKWRTSGLPKPDFLLSDFNLTEDTIDHSPLKLDNAGAVNVLRELKTALDVHDQWRHAYNKA
jgi:exonuclease III